MQGLRHATNRIYARWKNGKRTYVPYSWRWLNQFAGNLFWRNPGALIRPQYAWGIVFAAALAKALGRKEVAVVEFGVAGGRGLLAMQNIAGEVSSAFDIEVRVYGFDTGVGLLHMPDARDLPQLYRPGDYRMDVDALRKRLAPGTQLIIGDIKTTIDDFLSNPHPPVGFISFDMDTYTATRDSLKLFRGDFISQCLPRVVCYFDDIMGTTFGDLNGERLAMREYTLEHEPERGISPVYGLRYHVGWPHSGAQWPDMMFWGHFMDHPDYCTFDGLGSAGGQAPIG
ncbi:MAG: hypothetical protein ABJC09_00535 [Terriglobia bacterium]